MDITAEIICQDMMTLLGRFKQELARIADERGLTQVQLAALYMVQQHGELAMGKVAHVLHCDPSNVTGIVDRLVSHNLVTRQENPTDRFVVGQTGSSTAPTTAITRFATARPACCTWASPKPRARSRTFPAKPWSAQISASRCVASL